MIRPFIIAASLFVFMAQSVCAEIPPAEKLRGKRAAEEAIAVELEYQACIREIDRQLGSGKYHVQGCCFYFATAKRIERELEAIGYRVNVHQGGEKVESLCGGEGKFAYVICI